MTTLRVYDAGEVRLAVGRWKTVTKGSTKAFMLWMLIPSRYIEFDDHYMPPSFAVAKSSSAYRKMEMLLNPHWYALTKASMINDGVSDANNIEQ